jgi:hypothetical protein
MDHLRDEASFGANEFGADPPSRVKLDTMLRVRRELTRVYREARVGKLDVANASKLANILQIMGRMIESSDIEARLAVLEAKAEGR